MFWRAWCFLAGLAPGALAVLALSPGSQDPSWLSVQLGALGGAVLFLVAASLLARRPQDEPDRGAHFARAASAGLVAWPAIGAAILGLAPDPRILLAAIVALVGLAFLGASRRRAPAGGLVGQLGAALTALVGGAAAVLLLAGAVASLGAADLERTDENRNAVFDHDASIATVALPACAPRAERVEVLHAAGAHPRLDGSGENVFFDAPGPEGRRQIHRLARATGEVVCLTCGEPGNNRHPAPSASGGTVLFDTDRYASWRRPTNTDLQLLNANAVGRGIGSRRLTYGPGPDERPVFAPARNTLAWSQGSDGRYRIVSAGIISGHGSMQVGAPGSLREGGAAWLAPLAWSPNARTLAAVRGNPLGPARVDAVDLGTDLALPLGETASTAGGLSFNADGDWYVLATGRRTAAAGLLPGALGFAVAPALALDGNGERVHLHGTEVFWGATGGEPRSIDLGESAGWGWPTGIALQGDGKSFVLGQRRDAVERPEERLLAIHLDCS